MSKFTDRAAMFAADAHLGQVDKAGEPYMGHVCRVANMAEDALLGDVGVAVAYLHDVVEDSDDPRAMIARVKEEFGDDVFDAVYHITRWPDTSMSTGYYELVKLNFTSHVVKMYDIIDNSDTARLAKLGPETAQRLAIKYSKAWKALGYPSRKDLS